jgi:protein-L-isoaspartate(D-aspartate) O-methyltransferase
MPEDEFQEERSRMVSEQLARRGIRDARLLQIMGRVPRHIFVPVEDRAWAYADGPLPIGLGQTISQPYIVALMTELLQPGPDSRLLEIGTGSGYQAAVLAGLAGEVHSVEIVPELARRAEALLLSLGVANVQVHLADGSLGWPSAAPYHGILVAAAAPAVPRPLLDQLAEGGRLVLPVGGYGNQQLEVWERLHASFNLQKNISVTFVPLVGEFGWQGRV